MASPLENLSGPGKSLQKEPPDTKEYAGLKRSGLARLADAANITNSLSMSYCIFPCRITVSFGRA